MRILHVIPSISPLRGGPSAAALAMVAALRQHGVDAAILTTNDHGPGLDPDMPIGRWFDHGTVPVLAFPRWSPPLRALREFAVSVELQRWLAAHVPEYQLLHVHALFSYPSTAAMATARRRRVPYILRSIGQLSPWSLSRSALRKRWMLRLIERRNLQGAAALHFTSEAERQEAAPLALSPQSLVLPLGVSPPLAIPEDAPDGEAGEAGCRFLFLSRLHPKKQLDRLLEAFGRLHERHPEAPWVLEIAGDGDPAYVASLRRLAARLGLESHCHWLGFLEGEAKWSALRRADWFLLPSAAENFGIAVVEALAAGTPVIVSPQVAVAAAVAEVGAGRVCGSDPAELVGALESALSPPSELMRAAARNLARNRYSWASIASELASTYEQLIRADAQP